jgi:hypothetical protein
MKSIFEVSLALMLVAAVTGLVLAVLAGEFDLWSLAALTVGLSALLIIVGIVIVELVSRKFHPESGLFTWSDVDNLRALAAEPSIDVDLRDWARSLAERVAIVLPGRR